MLCTFVVSRSLKVIDCSVKPFQTTKDRRQMSLQVDRRMQVFNVMHTCVKKSSYPLAAADVAGDNKQEAYLIDALVVCCLHGILRFGDCSLDLGHNLVLLVQGIFPLPTQNISDEKVPDYTARDLLLQYAHRRMWFSRQAS